MHPVREEIEALLLRGAFSGERRLIGMCQCHGALKTSHMWAR
jgi:hypothetical protein